VELDAATALDRLTKAPLKPQQRLIILKTHLIPKLLHGLTLGNVSQGRLDQLDRQVRRAVRTWLKLPLDVPTAFFHASVSDGGLGIPSLLTGIPALTRAGVAEMEQSTLPAARAAFQTQRLQKRLGWARRVLSSLELPPEAVAEDRRRYWAARLHASVDGRELRETSKCAASSRLIQTSSTGIPGRDFIQHVHTLRNALPTRVRTSRGTRREERNVRCRAGCNETETAAHVIQRCHRTHGGRIKRHDALVATLASTLRQKGWEVLREPRFQTQEGLCKPDLLAVRERTAMVVDMQVVSGSGDLNESHKRKTSKYRDIPGMSLLVAERVGVAASNDGYTSGTLSWRGIWSARSHSDLLNMGVSVATLAGITTRTLQGSHTSFGRFMRMTSFRPDPG
jgi:hypothetical protein